MSLNHEESIRITCSATIARQTGNSTSSEPISIVDAGLITILY